MNDRDPLFPFDFGEYRVLRLLGRGGMGAVYEAEHRGNGRRLAIKVLGQTFGVPEARARFLREGILAATVNHPNSVYVFGTEEIEGTPVIVMELVRGGTLRDQIRRGPMEPGRAVDAILQVIDGLRAAAQKGVLHRDIKPANCFRSPDGTVKVGDYGLSISAIASNQSQLTASGILLGTPAFASPEQLRGEDLDLRSDIYSVGATLYSLLTGHAPFEAENVVQSVALALDRPPTPLTEHVPSIQADLARIVERCLAKQPKDRFQTYEALSDALEPFGSETAALAPLGTRFVAWMIDFAFLCTLTLIGVAVGSLVGWKPSIFWILFSLLWIYFPVLDDAFGGTPGKKVLGLRLIAVGKPVPRLVRGFLRTFLFTAPHIVNKLIPTSIYEIFCKGTLGWNDPPVFSYEIAALFADCVLGISFLFLPFLNAVFGKGIPWLDRLTGMRVVKIRSRRFSSNNIAAAVPVESPIAGDSGAIRMGSFRVLGLLGKNWFEAIDETLQRRVWIRTLPIHSPALSESRKSIARTTRLRWVSGVRTETEAWDAFEAISAEALPASPLVHWSIVRGWLLDLVEEIRLASQEGTLPPSLRLDLIRVNRGGRLTLLDEEISASETPSGNGVSTQGVQALLIELCKRSLDAGRLPLHAAELLKRLSAERFENLAVLEANLRSLISKPAEISRGLKLASIAMGLAPLLLFSFYVADVARAILSKGAVESVEAFGSYAPLTRALCAAGDVSLESVYRAGDREVKVTGKCQDKWPYGRKGFYWDFSHADLRDYVRGNYPEFFSEKVWEKDPRFSHWSDEDRKALQGIAKRQPPASERLALLNQKLQGPLQNPKFPKLFGLEFILWPSLFAPLFALMFGGMLLGALLSGLSILCWNRTVPNHLFGIQLINADGTPARRGLSLLRWALENWRIALLLVFGYAFEILGWPKVRLNLSFNISDVTIPMRLVFPSLGIALAIILVLFVIEMAMALWKPERNLVDRILGTRLVPK